MNQQDQKNSKNFAWPLFLASIAFSIGGLIAALVIESKEIRHQICLNNMPVHAIAYYTQALAQATAVVFGIISLIYALTHRLKKIGSFFMFFVNMTIIFIAITFQLNFFRFAASSCQSEAKQNLAAIWTAYTSYYSDYNTFPAAPYIIKDGKTYNCFNIADWEPMRKDTRYSYKCMGTVVYSPAKGGVDCEEAITGATQNDFTVAACANIDRDSTIDEWTIDTAKKLKNIVDDVKR